MDTARALECPQANEIPWNDVMMGREKKSFKICMAEEYGNRCHDVFSRPFWGGAMDGLQPITFIDRYFFIFFILSAISAYRVVRKTPCMR